MFKSIICVLVLLTFVTLTEVDKSEMDYRDPNKVSIGTSVIPPNDFTVVHKYAEKFVIQSYHGMSAETVYQTMDKENYFILDVRENDAYCAGHIKDAVNIPFHTIMQTSSIDQYPQDRVILTFCYTGHEASQATAILNLLGYEAYTIQFSATAWRDTTSVNVWGGSKPQDIYGGNFPMEQC
ncbi:rhodanese-related sulfurtransferases-related [Anaeramoeba flamelloides]|uniref:Rhodanese-related sulfurtransferases-related n=1 Tax=Anaeramoeba flamelloides TaxID=1746091 RepID=A0ABQ8YIS3_9EUKA|nr:rhodanese-related sulfurtransferases-related [Anaeramoeba flamelloides]